MRLVTYDRRSAGESEYVLDEYTVEDLAADARALLAHLEIERSIVIGDSMGGMVAQQYALAYPEHVSALCLVETGPDLMAGTTFGEAGRQLVERCRAEGDRAVFEQRKDELRNPPQWPGAAFGPSTPEAQARLQAMAEAMTKALSAVADEELFTYWAGAVGNQAAFLDFDFTPRLGELQMPAAVIHGADDTTVPPGKGKALHAGIGQSEYHEIAGATPGLLAYPAAAKALPRLGEARRSTGLSEGAGEASSGGGVGVDLLEGAAAALHLGAKHRHGRAAQQAVRVPTRPPGRRRCQ